MTWHPVLVAFAVGGALRAFEERVRREQLAVALTRRFDKEESRRAEELLAASPFYERWLLAVLMFVSPRRMVDRIRRKLGGRCS